MSEQSGRYQRSAFGMIGALLICVALIVAFVVLRDLNRSELQRTVEPVDYQQAAEFAETEGVIDVVVPVSLPEGWRATTVDYASNPDPRWHLGVLTDEERYVGVEQSPGEIEELVHTYVDETATQGEDRTLDGPGGPGVWTTWTDDGGDFALARRVDGTTILVVGTAPEDEIVAFTESLV